MSDEQPPPQAPTPRSMSFKSPAYIPDIEGYVLAIILRLVTIKKPHTERTRTDGVSVLTMANMESVVPYFAYFKHRMIKAGARTRADLDEVIHEWGGVELERWVDDHTGEIADSRKQLGLLFDAPGRPGFSCYDG